MKTKKVYFTMFFLLCISSTLFSQNHIVEFSHVNGNRTYRKTSNGTNENKKLRSEEVVLQPEANSIKGINVYPNPTTGLLNINTSQDIIKLEYSFIDENSKIIKQGIISDKNSTLDISDFKNGLYILKFLSQSFTCSFKIVKN